MIAAALALCLAAQAAPEPAEAFVPREYRTLQVRGWSVHVEEALDARPELAADVLDLLRAKLREIDARLPADVVGRLRMTPFWLHLDREGTPGGVYHPSPRWLEEHGFDPRWAGGIELANARNFLNWIHVQPSMVIHELAHAWHHKTLGYDDEGVRGAYERAKAAGLYDEVGYVQGGTQRAYGLNNPQEFFAELTEAWWGTNDFYPYVRGELLEHDPESARMIEAAWASVPRDRFPDAGTKKGLQVQMVDDAQALGVRHAAVNVQLGHLLALPGAAPRDDDVVRTVDGIEHRFARAALDALDAQVTPLADGGAVVYLILLARASGDARDEVVLHPAYDPACPNRLGAFDVVTPEGRSFLRAALDLLAERYAGRVWGWVVGNEVNSHWWWFNVGRADLDAVVAAYEPAVRLAHEALTRHVPAGRVYVSLEHHWTTRFAAGGADQATPGRDLLRAFAERARAGGDFPWHVAFHPYPEDLFDPRWWLDESAPDDADAPRVTFRNLEVLTRFLARDELRFDGAPRRVILSEQGFHRPDSLDGVDGELLQAAAYAAAWERVARLDAVDAFLLHRHVDHAREGGLRLGLWTNREGAVCEPDRPTRMREVFLRCDTPSGAEATRFALEVLGIEGWRALD